MAIIRMLEAVAACFFFFFMIFQVIVPLWKDRPICPWFRSSRRDLEGAIREINEMEEEQKLAKVVRKRTESIIKNEER